MLCIAILFFQCWHSADRQHWHYSRGTTGTRNGDYNWSPRSSYLTPLDFFLWDYVKDKVHADAPQLIQELKEEIRAVNDEIEPQMCENVMRNFMKRAWSCKCSRGGHVNDIVFYY